jgi:hypothetical protein
MISMSKPLPAGLALALLGFLTPGVAGAEPAACTCQNLESLQQDYQNAVYMEGFFRQKAAEMQAWETENYAKKVSRAGASDDGVDVRATSNAMLKAARETAIKPPFPAVKGYSGPLSVEMEVGTCKQSDAALKRMEDGSPCEALADAALAHELSHRDICTAMGAAAYWDRDASAFATEEADRYKAQAANLKAELGRVLEASEVKLRGEWRHALTGQGVEITYFYQFESGDMSRVSEGGERWAFSGEGETQNVLEGMKVPGVTCTGDGAIRNRFTVAMDTDGLSFGLDYTETNGGGDMTVTCRTPDGTGMGMALPSGGGSSGRLAALQPLVTGDNPLPNAWADAIKALAASEGMQVSGEPKTVLSVTCEKP